MSRALLLLLFAFLTKTAYADRCDDLRSDFDRLIYEGDQLKSEGKTLAELKTEHDAKMAELSIYDSIKKIREDYVLSLDEFKARLKYEAWNQNKEELQSKLGKYQAEIDKKVKEAVEVTQQAAIKTRYHKALTDILGPELFAQGAIKECLEKNSSCNLTETIRGHYPACNDETGASAQYREFCETQKIKRDLVTDFIPLYEKIYRNSKTRSETLRKEWREQIGADLPADHINTTAIITEANEKINQELASLDSCPTFSKSNSETCTPRTWGDISKNIKGFFAEIGQKISGAPKEKDLVASQTKKREELLKNLENSIALATRRGNDRFNNYKNIKQKVCKESKKSNKAFCESVESSLTKTNENNKQLAKLFEKSNQGQSKVEKFRSILASSELCPNSHRNEEDFLKCIQGLNPQEIDKKVENLKNELRPLVSKISTLSDSPEAKSIQTIKKQLTHELKACNYHEVTFEGCRDFKLDDNQIFGDRPIRVLVDNTGNVITELSSGGSEFSDEKLAKECLKNGGNYQLKTFAPSLCNPTITRDENRKLHEEYYVKTSPRGKRILEKRPTTGSMIGDALGSSLAQHGPSMFINHQQNKYQTEMLYNTALINKQSYYNYQQWLGQNQNYGGLPFTPPNGWGTYGNYPILGQPLGYYGTGSQYFGSGYYFNSTPTVLTTTK